jgi:hypothetical protein
MAARRVSKGAKRRRTTAGARKASARKSTKPVARGKRKTSARKKPARRTRARKTATRKSTQTTARKHSPVMPAVAAVDPFAGEPQAEDETFDVMEEMPSDIDDLVDDESFNDEDDFNS